MTAGSTPWTETDDDDSDTRRSSCAAAAGLGTAGLMPAHRLGRRRRPGTTWRRPGCPTAAICLLGLTGGGRGDLPHRRCPTAATRRRRIPRGRRRSPSPGGRAPSRWSSTAPRGARWRGWHAPEGRHFYGHGAFTADGGALFTTENDIADGRRAARRLGRRGRLPPDRRGASGGIGPHEVRLMPDGARLAVANGGIETDPTSGRAELNLADDAGEPRLSRCRRAGALLEVLELPRGAAPELDPPHRRRAGRHAGRGAAVAGLRRWRRRRCWRCTGRARAALELLAAAPEVQRRTRNYAGSVAVTDDGRRAAITAPRGGLMLVFDLARRGGVEVVEAADICGVAARGRTASPARPARGASCGRGRGRAREVRMPASRSTTTWCGSDRRPAGRRPRGRALRDELTRAGAVVLSVACRIAFCRLPLACDQRELRHMRVSSFLGAAAALAIVAPAPILAQDDRFEALAELPFVQNRPTPETAETLRRSLRSSRRRRRISGQCH